MLITAHVQCLPASEYSHSSWRHTWCGLGSPRRLDRQRPNCIGAESDLVRKKESTCIWNNVDEKEFKTSRADKQQQPLFSLLMYLRHQKGRQWQPCLQLQFSSTQPLQCSAQGRSHGALEGYKNDVVNNIFALWLIFHWGYPYPLAIATVLRN